MNSANLKQESLHFQQLSAENFIKQRSAVTQTIYNVTLMSNPGMVSVTHKVTLSELAMLFFSRLFFSTSTKLTGCLRWRYREAQRARTWLLGVARNRQRSALLGSALISRVIGMDGVESAAAAAAAASREAGYGDVRRVWWFAGGLPSRRAVRNNNGSYANLLPQLTGMLVRLQQFRITLVIGLRRRQQAVAV